MLKDVYKRQAHSMRILTSFLQTSVLMQKRRRRSWSITRTWQSAPEPAGPNLGNALSRVMDNPMTKIIRSGSIGVLDSVILMEQIRTLDKKRLRERMGCLDENHMNQVDEALAVSFGLEQPMQ